MENELKTLFVSLDAVREELLKWRTTLDGATDAQMDIHLKNKALVETELARLNFSSKRIQGFIVDIQRKIDQ